jgi:hypothetical protein
MKYELRSKKWFISNDGYLVQGLITKRELLEIDDHDEGQKTLRRYWLRTSWLNTWIDEDNLYDSIEALVSANQVPCDFE